MRRFWTMALATVLTATLGGWTVAANQPSQGRSHSPPSNRPSSGGNRPGGPAARPAFARQGNMCYGQPDIGYSGFLDRSRPLGSWYVYNVRTICITVGCCFSAESLASGSPYRYPIYVQEQPSYGSPPLLPDDWESQRPSGGVLPSLRRDDDEDDRRQAAQEAFQSRSITQARKFIGYGDAQFAKRKYTEALDRYRTASRSAPQLADACFRQGFALAAAGRYDLAATAFKRGLKLDPAWPQSRFNLDRLLADPAVKTAQFDVMANAVLDKPADPDRLFVLGVHLHFDGQLDRAAILFERAMRAASEENGHIQAFLDQAQPQAAGGKQ
jgi:hypothetical protein